MNIVEIFFIKGCEKNSLKQKKNEFIKKNYKEATKIVNGF